MRALLASLSIVALLAAPARTDENAPESAPEDRLIREEPSIARTMLSAPWMLVSLTAWPLKEMVFLMERTSFPTRVVDVVTFPMRVFDDEEKQ